MQLHLKEWAELPSILRSIENAEDRKEVTEKLRAQQPQIAGMLDSLAWMRNFTKTKDEQDPENQYKSFPQEKDYHRILHLLFLREPVFFVEKSRTMMTSWWAVAECTHFVQTNPPAPGVLLHEAKWAVCWMSRETWKPAIPSLE